MASTFEFLSNIPLFASLSTRHRRKLLKSSTEDRYEAGDVIVREGGRTQTLFLILEGTAKIVRDERTLARRSVGDFFGEISMIDRRRRAASVVAETSMRCLVLYHDDLRKLVMSDPQMAWSLVQTLASHLRDDWERPMSEPHRSEEPA
jgi:CRP/FNR family transcriptional regulator, cyclic AMP receptor protein